MMTRKKTTCYSLRHLLTRFLFLSHGILTFGIFFNNSPNEKNWFLTVPLVLLLIDIIVRKEFKHFWISAFLYIASLLPIIWLVEIDMLQTRLETLKIYNITIVSHEDGADYSHNDLPPVLKSNEKTKKNSLFNLDFLNLSNEIVAKKLCEIGIVVGLILGRAMMPRGPISHDKLSSMLLTFVSNSADIIGLFDTFVSPKIMYHDTIIYLVLGIFSWSIYQFTFIPVGEDPEEDIMTVHVISDPIVSRDSSKTVSIATDDSERILMSAEEKVLRKAKEKRRKKLGWNSDVCESLILLLMHDGPYLVLRLFLIFYHQVTTEMHIFFTIKNAMVVMLHFYRVCSLCCCNEKKEKKKDYNLDYSVF